MTTTVAIKPGLYIEFNDGQVIINDVWDVNLRWINSIGMSSEDFDRVASKSLIFIRMAEYIKTHNTILPCGTQLIREQLIADIEKLKVDVIDEKD